MTLTTRQTQVEKTHYVSSKINCTRCGNRCWESNRDGTPNERKMCKLCKKLKFSNMPVGVVKRGRPTKLQYASYQQPPQTTLSAMKEQAAMPEPIDSLEPQAETDQNYY